LTDWYKGTYNWTFTGDDNVASSTSLERETRWTASFICPILGDRFDSGALNDFFTNSDGINWYRNKGEDTAAAAAAAFDTLREKGTEEEKREFSNTISPSNSSGTEEAPMMQPGVGQSFLEDSNADRSSEDEDYIIKHILQQFGSSAYGLGGKGTGEEEGEFLDTTYPILSSSDTEEVAVMQPGIGRSFLEDSDTDQDSEDKDYVVKLIL
jgi:hypothetical protein